MPLNEGRCPNCGSILLLDTASDKGHCLFCDAVFSNLTAFEIARNPAGVVFPNETQPKYEGPSLDPAQAYGQQALSQKQGKQQVQKKAKPAPPPVYIPKEPTKLPDIRLSGKIKMQIGLAALVVILLVTGISVPLILRRNQTRAQLLQTISDIIPFTVNVDNVVSIRNQNNNMIILSAPESVTEAEAISLFKDYCLKRAQVQTISTDDFQAVYGQVTLKLLTPEGGYLIARPKNMAELDSGAVLTNLGQS